MNLVQMMKLANQRKSDKTFATIFFTQFQANHQISKQSSNVLISATDNQIFVALM